jgi:hypothetical protein
MAKVAINVVWGITKNKQPILMAISKPVVEYILVKE